MAGMMPMNEEKGHWKNDNDDLHQPLNMAKELIDSGIDVNAKTKDGKGALHFACEDILMAKLLLKHGADVNAEDNIGKPELF